MPAPHPPRLTDSDLAALLYLARNCAETLSELSGAVDHARLSRSLSLRAAQDPERLVALLDRVERVE
jgi:hypothetical protein